MALRSRLIIAINNTEMVQNNNHTSKRADKNHEDNNNHNDHKNNNHIKLFCFPYRRIRNSGLGRLPTAPNIGIPLLQVYTRGLLFI